MKVAPPAMDASRLGCTIPAMPTATQLPFVREPAARTGRKMFRKLILPVGTVKHPKHGDLHFTAERLAKLRTEFLNGAIDQTPFVLVDGENNHTDDPERFRGEVKGLELTAEGLRATIETSEGGTKLLTDNPNLPVSVRIKALADGREALAHVAGTFDPVAQRMGPWEPIDASNDGAVTDFSDGRWYGSGDMDPTASPPQEPTTAADALNPEEVGAFRSFLNRLKGTPAEPQTPAVWAATPPADPVLTDEDVTALLAGIPADAEPATPGTEPAMAGASLSDADRQTYDLAVQRAERAEVRTGTTELSRRLDEYITAGVPPGMVTAARSKLIGDSDAQKAIAMDFANGTSSPVADALFAALDTAKGTIDFSERGTTVTVDLTDAERKAEQERCDKAAQGYV